jgi:hypothetical protein
MVPNGSTTLAENDLKRRIHLARITNRQDKNKKTIEILEMTESGLRKSDIAKKQSNTRLKVSDYRQHALETIENVEQKINEYYWRGCEKHLKHN